MLAEPPAGSTSMTFLGDFLRTRVGPSRFVASAGVRVSVRRRRSGTIAKVSGVILISRVGRIDRRTDGSESRGRSAIDSQTLPCFKPASLNLALQRSDDRGARECGKGRAGPLFAPARHQRLASAVVPDHAVAAHRPATSRTGRRVAGAAEGPGATRARSLAGGFGKMQPFVTDYARGFQTWSPIAGRRLGHAN